MPAMHACAHPTTLQVGPHLATTCLSEVAKAADVCSTLKIHSQYECCTSAEFAGCHPIFFFFYKMTWFSESAVEVEVPIWEMMRFERTRDDHASGTQE